MDTHDNYITSIFNYCDRWCERCPFTSRCRSFTFKEDMDKELEKNKDDVNGAFWKAFDTMYKDMDIREPEGVIETGIENDSDEVEVTETDDFDFDDDDITGESVVDKAQNTELAMAAQQYSMAAHAWFETHAKDLGKYRDLSFEEKISEIPGLSASEIKLTDAIAVADWYRFFISAKIVRAHFNRLPVYKELPVDSDENGSAKIALIAISRSITAWSIIRGYLKDATNETAAFIGQLISLRRAVEQAFPRAYDFVRPGFDDTKR